MNQHLYDLLLAGPATWNAYRTANPHIGGDSGPNARETDAEYLRRRELDISLDLNGANLRGRTFEGYNFREAQFWNADLRGARFVDCALEMAWFERANLDWCHFVGSVAGAGFPGASLVGVQFIACTGHIMVDSKTVVENIELIGCDLFFLSIDVIPTTGGESTMTAEFFEWNGCGLVRIEAEPLVAQIHEVNPDELT